MRETLSALSNDRGGVLLLGLAEEAGFRPAAGFDAVKIRDDLVSACSDIMEPPVRADIEIADLEDAQVVVATVPEMEAATKPCYVKAKGMTGGSYTRGGDGDRLMTSYEIFMLHANRGQPRDDEGLSRAPVWRISIKTLWVVCCVGSVSACRNPSPGWTTYRTRAIGRAATHRRLVGCHAGGPADPGSVAQQYLPQLCVTFIAVPAVSKDAVPGGRASLHR